MSGWARFWLGSIGFLILVDFARSRLRDGSTLSEVTRSFISRTPYARFMFPWAWFGFAVWFHRHIVRGL